MADKPIIFSAAMVQALLAGRKSQTRRVLSPQPEAWAEAVELAPYRGFGRPGALIQRALDDSRQHACGKAVYAPGDRLWVRETWTPETDRGIGYEPPFADRPILWSEGVEGDRYWTQPHYRATDPEPDLSYPDRDGPSCIWRPSIYMPRWASRLTLTVTDVRVERLQDISEADAIAEGGRPFFDRENPEMMGIVPVAPLRGPVHDFRRLWNSIHGPEAWAANPWVVAVSFRAARRNIDDGEPR